MATALVLTMVGGVAAAVGDHPTSAKACVAANGGLRLPTASGKCAGGTTRLTLDATGPRGATGARGATGPAGPKGDPGPAGTGQRVNFSQPTPESAGPTPPAVTHYLGTAGPVAVFAACQGTVGTSTKLILFLAGGTGGIGQALTYFGTNATADPAATTTSTAAASTILRGTIASPGSSTAVDTMTTTDTSSTVVTLVVVAADGSQVTATLDVELNATDAPACTVGGTMIAT